MPFSPGFPDTSLSRTLRAEGQEEGVKEKKKRDWTRTDEGLPRMHMRGKHARDARGAAAPS